MGKGDIRREWHSLHTFDGTPSAQGQAEVSAIRFSPASLPDLRSTRERDASPGKRQRARFGSFGIAARLSVSVPLSELEERLKEK